MSKEGMTHYPFDGTNPSGYINRGLLTIRDYFRDRLNTLAQNPLAPYGAGATTYGMMTQNDPKARQEGLDALSMAPGLFGDIVGPAADLHRFYQFPEERTLLNFGLAGFGALPVIPAMLAGKNAATANLDMLEIAQEAEKKGVQDARIFDATGWFKGADGEWRFEIDDSAAVSRSYQLTPAKAYKEAQWKALMSDDPSMRDRVREMQPYSNKTKKELVTEYKRTGGEIFDAAKSGDKAKAMDLINARSGLDGLFAEMGNAQYGPFSSYVKHQQLGEAYPDIYRMHTRLDDSISDQYRGQYFQGNNRQGEQIVLAEKPTFSDGRSTALHEAQHAIQQREGFARGGNPDDMGKVLDEINFQEYLAKDDALTSEFEELKRTWAGKEVPKEVEERVWELRKEIEANRARGWKQANDPFSRPNWSKAELNDAYRRLAGEVEARNVQARMGLLGDDRRMLPPWMTEDVPRDKQIIRRKD